MKASELVQEQMEIILLMVRAADDGGCLVRIVEDFELIAPWLKLAGFTETLKLVKNSISDKVLKLMADELTRGNTVRNAGQWEDILRRLKKWEL